MNRSGLLVGTVAVAAVTAWFFWRSGPLEPGMPKNFPSDPAESAQREAGGSSGNTELSFDESETTASEIPEADLLAGLAAICSSTLDDEPEGDLTQEELDSLLREYQQKTQAMAQQLSVSGGSGHLLLAAMLTPDSAAQVDLLQRAMATNPNHSFLLSSAVRICSESDFSADCPLEDWEQRLIAIDGSNGESWARIAANRYAAGEKDGALEAMKYAATSAEVRSYWVETVEMTVRSLAAVSDDSFAEKVNQAFGLAAAQLPQYGDYLNMCRALSRGDVEWAYACRDFGRLLEVRGRTVMGTMMSFAIQKAALDALSDVEAVSDVERREQLYDSERRSAFVGPHPAAERLAISTPAIFYSYLAAVRSDGELAARQQMETEVQRLISQQPELACD